MGEQLYPTEPNLQESRFQALLLDFDGVFKNTELAVIVSWNIIFSQYGINQIRLEKWAKRVGDPEAFNPFEVLLSLTNQISENDRDTIYARRQVIKEAIADRLPILPGIIDWITEARKRGMQVAVVSSSERAWIVRHLQAAGLMDSIDLIVAEEDVEHKKPHPDPYHEALKRLGITASQAIAVEDSLHGKKAATTAGIACVTVSNETNRKSGIIHEGPLALESLDQISLREIIEFLESNSA